MIRHIGSDIAQAATGQEKNQDKLKEACAQFESLFVNYLFKSMRASISETGLAGNSQESKIFTSMFDEKLAQEIAAGGGIGLGRVLFEQLNNKKT